MGFYINPQSGTKEEWLSKCGRRIIIDLFSFEEYKEYLPVCLVDNGPFTAAGICYNECELDAFSDPMDSRPKKWYVVPTYKLLEVCPSIKEVVSVKTG
jgi:hypothetical protein